MKINFILFFFKNCVKIGKLKKLFCTVWCGSECGGSDAGVNAPESARLPKSGVALQPRLERVQREKRDVHRRPCGAAGLKYQNQNVQEKILMERITSMETRKEGSEALISCFDSQSLIRSPVSVPIHAPQYFNSRYNHFIRLGLFCSAAGFHVGGVASIERAQRRRERHLRAGGFASELQ